MGIILVWHKQGNNRIPIEFYGVLKNLVKNHVPELNVQGSVKFIIDDKDQANVTNIILELAVNTAADVETYSWSLVLDGVNLSINNYYCMRLNFHYVIMKMIQKLVQ